MTIRTHSFRVVVELDEPLYEALQAEVEARSSNIRRATMTEVVRSLIADHLVPARIPSAAQ